MSAERYVGRVGAIAAALGVGAAIFGGTAIAVADTAGPHASAAASAGSAPAPSHGARGAATGPTASAPARAGTALPAAAAKTLTLPAPAAALPAATAQTPPYSPTPPNPDATISTPYGTLGQWMINKNGQVADWLGQPYCGKGSTAATCKKDSPNAKTIQEPINTVFVVKAANESAAQLRLTFALTTGGFGASPLSSVGYSAIVGNSTDAQYPRWLPLLGKLANLGAAYRDLPFFLANTHLRTFGGESDGKGDYVFTASVSEENVDASGGGLLPAHGFESFDQARTTLVDQMVKRSWITGASNMGMIAMDNEISPDDPMYTTGDADGLAQVIGIGTMLASSPSQSISPASSSGPTKTVTAV